MVKDLEKKLKDRAARKWILMLFIGPGIFFIVYWFMTMGVQETPSHSVPLPKEYNISGDMVRVGDFKIQAGLRNRDIFTRELDIGKNNHAIAETGKVFFIVPVFAEDHLIINSSIFEAIDSKGVRYKSLDVDKKYLARAVHLKETEIPQGMSESYLVFKVNKNVEGYYLVMNMKEEKVVWYFKR